MKQTPLWRISVTTTPEAQEAVSELLEALTHTIASAYTDIKSATTTVAVYVPRSAGWAKLRAALRNGLRHIRDCGLSTGPGRIHRRRLRRGDWAHSWRRHFKPIEISRGLLIKPGWSRRRARKNQAVVVLDPGLSFGTGQHPTTRFCLGQIAVAAGGRPRLPGTGTQSFLDIGTGSGILAIAAAKLGYSPVDALDLDPAAVRIALQNARRNRVAGSIRFRCADLMRLPARGSRKFDLICANLISDLLIKGRLEIRAWLKPGGRLVAAGILKGEFPTVRAALEASGLKLVASCARNEWRSGTFVFGQPQGWKLT